MNRAILRDLLLLCKQSPATQTCLGPAWLGSVNTRDLGNTRPRELAITFDLNQRSNIPYWANSRNTNINQEKTTTQSCRAYCVIGPSSVL
jgi:hypothetical protein